MQAFLGSLLIVNALWFGAAFRYFALTPAAAAKLLVPATARGSPLFQTVAASVRFLGGMNLAMAAFSVLLLAFHDMFTLPGQRALFAAVFAVGHGSQFVCNVPIAAGGGRRGEALWPVLSGPMLFIFAVDFAMMVANAAACALLLCRA